MPRDDRTDRLADLHPGFSRMRFVDELVDRPRVTSQRPASIPRSNGKITTPDLKHDLHLCFSGRRAWCVGGARGIHTHVRIAPEAVFKTDIVDAVSGANGCAVAAVTVHLPTIIGWWWLSGFGACPFADVLAGGPASPFGRRRVRSVGGWAGWSYQRWVGTRL
jgi:hypothetical protein